MLLRVDNQSGHYLPKQTQNSQFFDELESRGIPADQLDLVERAGVTDSGEFLTGKTQADFRKAENWKPGDYIPDDWDDLL